ncbi:hypothetical protein SELMODRAFT_423222 [Selaginella moellendorffii]|uniref:Protein kinase domain-containing protein n=1 Tax=Selaginella moellendorffii TaxID=88036 RepID=D8SKZ2_SELML|nr:hypothetical protein SELMODRAFT_423222 [Selaginella moellendorffii]
MELEVIRQLAVSAGLGDGRSQQTPIVIRGWKASTAGGLASSEIERMVEAATEKALAKRQKTTTSYVGIGKQVIESDDYNFSCSSEITSQFTDAPQLGAAMTYLLEQAGQKSLIDLALEEARTRDKEMDDNGSKCERYRKEDLGYRYIRGDEIEVQLAIGRIIRILEQGSREENASYRMGCIAQDTSRSGIPGSSDKPDYSFRTADTAALSWSLVAFVMELKDELAEVYTECLGETTARLNAIKVAQSSRKFAYAVLLCRREIQVQKLDMADEKNQFTFTQRYPWGLEEGFGLRLLVGILLGDGRVHGFSPPPQMQGRITLADGSYLQDMKAVALKGRKHASPSDRGCLVYKANLVQGQSLTDVAVKICPGMDDELFVLGMLTEKKVAGVLPILYSGKLQNRDCYLVTRYCQQITLDMQAEAILSLARGVAMTLGRLSREGVVHGDVSIGNIVYGTDRHGGIHPYLVDFGSAVTGGLPGKAVGTLTFAAVQTLLNGKLCLSSDLECLFYVVVFLALQGKTYWGRAVTPTEAADRKTRCFSLESEFKKEVIKKCKRAGLVVAIQKLRDLFWKCGYNENVQVDQFVQCLI